MPVLILRPQSATTPSYVPITRIRHLATSSVTATTNIHPRSTSTAPRPTTVLERQPTASSLRTIMPAQNAQRPEKRPVSKQSIEELLGLGSSDDHPVRKRERLNHLTAEEKLNRRKLKNRVAAQTARDRKKYRTTKLEEAVRSLALENASLREENKSLKKTCEELKNQNTELQKLMNSGRCVRNRKDSCSEAEVSSSSNIMPSSSSSSSSSLGSAESIRGPQQREQAMQLMMRSLPILMLFCLAMNCKKFSTKSAQWMKKLEQIRRCIISSRSKSSSSSITDAWAHGSSDFARRYLAKLIAVLRRRIALSRNPRKAAARLEWIAQHRISL